MGHDQDSRSGDRARSEQRGDWRGNDRSDPRSGRERGFFDRAGDEISSWFGDEEAERRREMDDRGGGGGRHEERARFGREHERERDRERGGWFGGGRDPGDRARDERREQDRGGWFGGRSGPDRNERDYGAHRDAPRDRDFSREQYGRQNLGPHQSYGREDYAPRQRDDEYRPFAGDYGRVGGESQRGGERQFGREEEQRGGNRGGGSAMPAATGGHFGDPHYHEWRQQQIEALDRDYDEYRREHQSKFANDFTGWRTQRQSKKQLLGEVREQMEVVGSDGERVGTVDKVRDERVILAKNDPEAGGVHRSLGCALIDRVEDGKLILARPADEARRELRQESGSSAPPTRAPQPTEGGPVGTNDGPHNLERSFSGTYR